MPTSTTTARSTRRPRLRRSRVVGQPGPAQPRLSQGASLAIDPLTGARADRLAAIQRRRPARCDRHRPLDQRRRHVLGTHSRRHARPLRSAHDRQPTFRTNAFPTLAIDGSRSRLPGVVGARVRAPTDAVVGDARIVVSTSTNGTTWSPPARSTTRATPATSSCRRSPSRKASCNLVYYDLREDHSQLFGEFVDEGPILDGTTRIRSSGTRSTCGRRKPIQVRLHRSRRSVSRSTARERVPGVPGNQQLEFSPPNLPIFRVGHVAIHGRLSRRRDRSCRLCATDRPGASTPQPTASPVFHGIWTDNRDVRPPANGVWTRLHAAESSASPGRRMSGFDPTQTVPAVRAWPGRDAEPEHLHRADHARPRRRRSGQLAHRCARLCSAVSRSSRRTTAPTITDLSPDHRQPAGRRTRVVQAVRAARDARRAGAARDRRWPAPCSRAQAIRMRRSTSAWSRSLPPDGAPVPNGQQGTIVLNPDPTNPELENPEPRESRTRESGARELPRFTTRTWRIATVRNPDLENPELENPDLENPDLENATVVNPSILQSRTRKPRSRKPGSREPRPRESRSREPRPRERFAERHDVDHHEQGQHRGRRTPSSSDSTARSRPASRASSSRTRSIKTPVVLGCSLLKQTQTVLLANIPNPRFVAADELPEPRARES